MTEPALAGITAIAEAKLAESIRQLALAETKAAAEGRIATADEINKKAREIEWRLAALKILKEATK